MEESKKKGGLKQKKGKEVITDPVFKLPIYLQVKFGEMEPSSYLKAVSMKQFDTTQVMKFLVIPENTVLDIHHEKVVEHLDPEKTLTK